MNLAQNIQLRGVVRADMRQYGREVLVPADMSDSDIQERLGDQLKAGLIKKIKRVEMPGVTIEGGAEVPGVETGAAVKKARAAAMVPAPPAVQIFGQSPGAAADRAHVTGALSGPTIIEHISAYSYELANALNMPMEFSLHASQSPDVGPFGGEISVFRMEDPQALYGILNPYAIQIYKQRWETAVGYQTRNIWEFFPRVTIPFSTFYLNLTVGRTNHQATIICTVSFGPIQAAQGAAMSLGSLEPRPTYAEPEVKAVAPAKVLHTETFFGFAKIKEYEAQGHRIIWPTIRAIPGRPGYSEVSVI